MFKMVKVDGYELPEGLYYSENWFWAKVEGDKVRLGITDYAQKQLREIVFVELPTAGGTVSANAPFGSVESVKAVSDLISPLTGTIDQVNQDVTSKPETLNEDPFGKGWLLIITPSNLNAELSTLMDFNKSVEWHKSLIAKG
jgi:glycine cleavage system H protein